ncbi:hypothetical protein [Sphingobium fluviale]|uniref:Uncharacterized protein n=1 Tax=Sphingobium fluviale TaxID=2506423 RepID=A0A4Q1KHC8_9SPHN|nr:hypothetical protein [Sphingobium fluviale]RXR29153.1 hypothetical protein EQG66_06560 [Sphingobium fluviale]
MSATEITSAPTKDQAAAPVTEHVTAAYTPAASIPLTLHPDKYQLRELSAQELTANASVWMAAAAVLTLVITSLGTFFIWGQVRLTRKAVEEAVAGTEATREANAIARQTGEAQVRCYLSPKEVQFCIDNLAIPHVRMNFLNSGQSPARNFRWVFQVRVKVMPDGWDWENQPREPGGGRDIPAQQEETVELAIVDEKPISQGNLSDLLLEPEARITVSIKAIWDDVFGTEWSETWLFQATAATGVDVYVAMFPDFT